MLATYPTTLLPKKFVYQILVLLSNQMPIQQHLHILYGLNFLTKEDSDKILVIPKISTSTHISTSYGQQSAGHSFVNIFYVIANSSVYSLVKILHYMYGTSQCSNCKFI